MSILPQNPTPTCPGRRWEARRYPRTTSICPRFRADLRSDLESLAGVARPLREQAASGRGLLLIHRQAGEWGADPALTTTLGTVLWVEPTHPTPTLTYTTCVCGGVR
ncbi:hypothetical protein ACFWZ7_13275 [Nocardiopsis alba]|uniref:Uncharacterized protein n=1 Tax=Nocardiopsis alba (strain ATCC BAA-2165 / BE74) TaxID=1205910 RepID=J7L9X3_NOCAA|nr:hypothetical protein [Nocardiopsis alba]AFR09476.1 hypothetical protein B005_1708 [Nocardiopsis alba ATCC BAA-2165]